MSTPLSAAIFLSASQLHIETTLHVKVGEASPELRLAVWLAGPLATHLPDMFPASD
jgi:hypothetical protein